MKVFDKNLYLIIESSIIRGRKLEKYSTLLSRKIVQLLKDQEIRDALSSISPDKEIQLKNPVGIDTIISDLTNIRDFYIVLSTNDENYADIAGNYVFNTSNRENSDFYMVIDLPRDYEFSLFSILIPELKETIRHELEHSSDDTETLSIPPDEKWNSLENLLDHFISEAETKAYVTGLYKKAKMTKSPAVDVIDQYLLNVYNVALSIGYDKSDLDPIMKKIRDTWMKYLIKRYPRARLDECALIEEGKRSPSAGIIIVKRLDNEWRVLGLRLYGKYDIPKGKIEPNESSLEAAIRETKEEAGISDLNFRWGLSSIRANHVTLYIAQTMQEGEIKQNPETGIYEHHGLKWMSWEELESSVYPYLAPAIVWAKDIVDSQTNINERKKKRKKKKRKIEKSESHTEEAYEIGTKKNLYLDRPTSHGGWPEGPSKSFTSNKPVNIQISSWLKDMGMMEKHILEKILSRILTESIEYFGKGASDFKALVDERVDPHRAALQSGWSKIGTGLTRTVYASPDNDEIVLKVANSDEHINLAKQTNAQEASSVIQRYGIFPKVYERDEEGLWIMVEKVTPIKDWEDMGKFFPEINIASAKLLFTLTLYLGSEEERLSEEEFDEKLREMGSTSPGRMALERYEQIRKNPIFKKLATAIAEYNIEPIEIAPRNVGTVMRDGIPTFVLLDISIGLGAKEAESTMEF